MCPGACRQYFEKRTQSSLLCDARALRNTFLCNGWREINFPPITILKYAILKYLLRCRHNIFPQDLGLQRHIVR